MQCAARLDHPRVTLNGHEEPLSHSQARVYIQGIMDCLQPALDALIETLWSEDELWNALRTKRDASGQKLPAQPSPAAQRLGLWGAVRERMIEREVQFELINSRYQRMLQGQAVSAMRSLIEQELVVQDIIAGKAPQGAFTWVRNLRRAITSYELAHEGAKPSGLRDVVEMPEITVKLAYQYADKQIVKVELGTQASETGEASVLIYKAECRHPDGSWFAVSKRVPSHYAGMDLALATPPMLWVEDGAILMRVSNEVDEPQLPDLLTDPSLQVDWNVTGSLATMTTARQSPEGMIVDAQCYDYNPTYLIEKRERLRAESEDLRAKIKRIKMFYDIAATDKNAAAAEAPIIDAAKRSNLDQRLQLLEREAKFVDKSRQDLNTEIATRFAHETMHIVMALGIRRVIVEDLASLEARRGKLTKAVRALMNQSPRGLMYERLEAACRKNGVAFERVSARNTSSQCPHCGGPITHPVHRESYCTACDLRGDRDEWASIRIGLKFRNHARIHRRRTLPRKAERAITQSWLDARRESARGSISPAYWTIRSRGLGLVEK
jgi:hypothetical protein